MKHEITRADILPIERYTAERAERKKAMSAIKRDRRLEVGPFATFYFENYQTMLQQVHEMLFIEGGGEAQIAGELEAYNPLIPKGAELVSTVMLEIGDAERRAVVLAGLGGIEETARIVVGGEIIAGLPEADIDRTTAAGKASAVQFIHFPFSPARIEAFRKPGAEISVGFTHPGYGHMAAMPERVRAALAEDFA
ncbi:MAG: DUF3501 family protein [Alphaproteobacteria bacterium]